MREQDRALPRSNDEGRRGIPDIRQRRIGLDGGTREGVESEAAVRLTRASYRPRKIWTSILIGVCRNQRPHPEEPCAARRLEGWPLATISPVAILRDADLRSAPQDEVRVVLQPAHSSR